MAIQEAMQFLALSQPSRRGVFLFEDHKIDRDSFLLPAGCSKMSKRAWLLLRESQGWLESTDAMERRAIVAGRLFSRLRFPPD